MSEDYAEVAPALGPDTPIETVFFRKLADVYLLIDHISSQSDKSLPAQLDLDGDGKGDSGDWIARICEIASPPEGSRHAIAKDADFLITTRDALNRLAEPATSATIAFTLLVVDQDMASVADPPQTDDGQDASARAKQPAPNRLLRPLGRANRAEQRRPVHNSIAGLTRYDLATQAFPELEAAARRFARFYRLLIWGMTCSLFLVLLLSWYVAMGNSLLVQLHTARLSCQGLGASEETLPAREKNQPANLPSASGAKSQPMTEQHQQYLCNRYAAALSNMTLWTSTWAAASQATGRGNNIPAGSDHLAEPSAEEIAPGLWGAALVNVLGNKVLPACYGLLGAWAAVLRGLSARVEKSVLARRHLMSSLVKLALGAVIGACIGLFVTPTDGDAKDAPGLLGTATISFSALSFLAGYGVEHVFPLLDGLLDRFFAPPGSTRKTA